jgi:hypothetical protein
MRMAYRLEKFSRYRHWLQPIPTARPQTALASCGGCGHHAIAALTFGKLGWLSFSGFLPPTSGETHENKLSVERAIASNPSA